MSICCYQWWFFAYSLVITAYWILPAVSYSVRLWSLLLLIHKVLPVKDIGVCKNTAGTWSPLMILICKKSCVKRISLLSSQLAVGLVEPALEPQCIGCTLTCPSWRSVEISLLVPASVSCIWKITSTRFIVTLSFSVTQNNLATHPELLCQSRIGFAST